MSQNIRHSQISQLKRAENLIRSKKYKKAIDILVPYLKSNPNSENGWLLLSYAVQNPNQKLECLIRARRINPENPKVQERLLKLQRILKKPKTLSKPFKRPPILKRRSLLFVVLLILGLGLVAVILTLTKHQFVLNLTGESTEKITSTSLGNHSQLDIIIAQTSQPGNQVIQTPSVVASTIPSPTLIPTSSPTATPSVPTHDFDPSSNVFLQEMESIQSRVSDIRGLGILEDYPSYTAPGSKTHEFLEDLLMFSYPQDEINTEVRVMTAFGLIEPSYDLFSNTMIMIGEGLGSFFVPWTDELFLIGDEFAANEKIIYAHAYDHALLDQHFFKDKLESDPNCIYNMDQCLAISALIEGDATLLVYQWLESYASEEEILALNNTGFSPINKIITSLESPPPYLIRETYFKYFDGKNFVEVLYDKGGWTMVNNAYEEPYLTTEHILHPKKYLNGEYPQEIELIPLEGFLGDEWELIKTGTLGELKTQMILGYNSNDLVQIDPIKASEAAAGWDGDQYQVFYRGQTDHTVLVSQWRWDTKDDSIEFWNALTTYMNRRYFGRNLDEVDESCWATPDVQYSCIFRTSRNTLWVMAPDWNIMQLILEQYPQFQQ